MLALRIEPKPDETLFEFIDRLAAKNYLLPEEILGLVSSDSGRERPSVSIDKLARLSGVDEVTLKVLKNRRGT